jgi:hypothetical protein
VPFFVIDSVHGDPGSLHATREECLAIVDGMVRDGIAQPGEFSVIEVDDEGEVVGEPFAAASELERSQASAAGAG